MHALWSDEPSIATLQHEERGSVVAPHDTAVRAGLRMYELGGNAVDAAIAAALVSGVIEPTETTLAGSGFLIMARDGEDPIEVDFGPLAPLAANPTMFELDRDGGADAAVLGLAPVVGNANVDGPLAAGVPRTLLGLVTAQERFGRLARDVVVQPAIDAAHDGFPAEGWFITSALSDVRRLRRDPTAGATFLDDDGLPRGSQTDAGYGRSFGSYPRVTQPLLGRSLEIVATSGAAALTTGEVARALAATSAEIGGLLTKEDLVAAVPSIRTARLLHYRDAVIAASNAPSGGLTELQALNVWQRLGARNPDEGRSPAAWRYLALALRRAFADRYHWLGDAEMRPIPVDALLSATHADRLAALVKRGDDVPSWSHGSPWLTFASEAAHDPWDLSDLDVERPRWEPSTATSPTSGTTHISAADRDGTVVSITHTAANHFGNGIVCPRTGLLSDSAMAWFNAAPGAANSIAGGARALANMGPLVVVGNDGSRAALGASGGRRIVSALVQLAISLVDDGRSAAEALAFPRIDASGRSLILPQSLHHLTDALSDLDPLVVTQTNEPYPMDFSRPNIARYLGGGRTEAAIAANHYNS
jgi:gamma-glutamyltranspeptidase/glutathione hydrolase